MDKLFSKVTTIIRPGTRIEVYSALTQSLVGSTDIVLWDERPLQISESTYTEFKDIIRQKSCKFYALNKILPYHDFCIALLCCIDYSLNHKLTPDINSRTYASAWRTMSVIADTSTDGVKSWIKTYINDRTSIGYTNNLGEVLQRNNTLGIRRLSNEMSEKVIKDDEIISIACSSRDIVEISSDNSLAVSSIYLQSTSTPEGQLDILSTIHDIMNDIKK
jgi:hypothetical protein